jgi:hypothetical protein
MIAIFDSRAGGSVFGMDRAKDDLVVIDVQQPLACDGDPVGVQAKALIMRSSP